jgi:endonuclease/exonuclease/phosphatase (EEP) superfamily protein YafD
VTLRPNATPVGLVFVGAAAIGSVLLVGVRLSSRVQELDVSLVAVAGISDLLIAGLVVLALAGAAIGWWGGSRGGRWAVVGVLIPAVCLAQMVWPTAVGLVAPEAPPPGPHLSVAAQNLWIANPDPDRAARILVASEADVLVLTEFTPSHLRAFVRAGGPAAYPYREVRDRPDPQGMAVMSKVPFEVDPRQPSSYRIVMSLRPPGADPVPLIAVHVPAPVGGGTGRWSAELGQLAIRASVAGPDVVLAGDFNSDSGHAPFRRMASLGRVRDAQDAGGGGFRPTWSEVSAYPPLLRLDHVMVGSGTGVAGFDFLPLVGSDHRGVLARLQLRRR